MKVLLVIIFAALGFFQSVKSCDGKKTENAMPTPEKQTRFDRLPNGIKLETEVRKDVTNEKGEIVSFEITTVEKRLNELKAKYDGDKLVDGKGKEIRFFEPLCRGVSQGMEEDEKAQKEKDRELSELKKKYTVIVLYCDPRKAV